MTCSSLQKTEMRPDEDVAPLLGYMRAGRIEHGLLINVGGRKFEIRKYILQDAINSL